MVNDVGYIADDIGSNGAVTVSGIGLSGGPSTWTNTSDLVVGQFGTGSLGILSGGSVSNLVGYVGASPGSQGTVIVSGRAANGAISTWTNADHLRVGDEGTGILTVEEGGALNTGAAYIGFRATGQGTAIVRGQDASGNASTWVNTGDLVVGLVGTGALTIQDGGDVTSSGGWIGADSTASGTVTISSSNAHVSTWSVRDTLFVGNNGIGTLTIDPGGLIRIGSNATIAASNTATGTLNLVGTAAGRGTLEAGSVIKGAGSAILNLDGGLLRATRDESDFLSGFTSLALSSGGAWFDTNAHDIGMVTAFSGSSDLVKLGLGTLTLTGDSSTFTGTTRVEAGTLAVNGIVGGTMVVNGGRLQGGGTVGTTSVLSGGMIAPGNSIGTLTIDGAYSQAAGSTYQVEVDPGTVTSDLIKVNGTATLANGATLSVINTTGIAYSAGQRYTILTSTGGLAGTYGFDQALTPFFSLRNDYDSNNAYLSVVQTATAGSAGSTPNEVQVGNSVDSLPNGNEVHDGIYSQANLAAARVALNQMSGEVHASVRTALIDESWILRNAANDRLRAAFGSVGAPSMATMNYAYTADRAPAVKGPMPKLQSDRFAVWGQGFGGWGRIGSDGNGAKLSRSTGGFLLGADVAAFDNLRIGMLAGYSRTDFDVKARASSGESDNYHLGIYGGGQWGALSLRTGASYTWHDVSTSRLVTAAFLGGNPRADFDAATAQIFGEVGYRMGVAGIELEPFAGLAYVNLHTGRFAERGAATALSASGDETGVGYATLGLRASTKFDIRGMDLTLRGGLAWRHAFGDVNPSMTMAFAGSTPFTVSGLPIARDAAVIEAGADMAIGRNATLGIAYNGQLARDMQHHSFKGVLAARF